MHILRRTLCDAAKLSVSRSTPKLAVFDLDHTLWPFGIDSFCFTPPYHRCKTTGKVIDMSGKPIEPFADTRSVLRHMRSIDVAVAVASRTKYPTGAYALLKILDLEPYIQYFEIYPGQKTKHFGRLREQSGAEYSEMIFFDDEPRNIEDIGPLGVSAVLVDPDHGATELAVRNCLKQFAAKSNSSSVH